MKVERPPELWEADTEDVQLLPLLGEMIASGLATGADLAGLTLSASNVSVEPDEPNDESEPSILPGDYVALSVRGNGDWDNEGWWPEPRVPQARWLARMDQRLRTAGAQIAYVRRLPDENSVTVFFRRSPG